MDSSKLTDPQFILFAILSLAAVGMSLLAMTRRNPVTAVMSLVGTFIALAGIYATLSAHFLTILQVAVYAGAIMVLFIFVVMILNREEVSPLSFRGIITRLLGVGAAIYLLVFVFTLVLQAADTPLLAGPTGELPADFGTVKSVGRGLFTEFVFPFEAISVLLLVAIVGGVVVSRSAKQEEQAEEVARRQAAIRKNIVEEKRLGGALPAAEDHHGDHGHGQHAAHGHH